MSPKRTVGFAMVMTIGLGAVGAWSIASPDDKHDHAAQSSSNAKPALDRLKQLQGDWVYAEGNQKGELAVKYTIGSGGNVVVENIFVGTPNEMVTVYHLDGDKLMMTHYCAAGNNPQMHAEPSTDGKLVFTCTGGSNMKETDGHMHAMTMTMIDDDHLSEAWTWKDDSGSKTETFSFERVKN